MIDASEFLLEKNIEETKKVVDMAHKADILVEGELGRIKGQEDEVIADDDLYTDAEEAVRYVNETKVDLLAIAIGTNHGVTKGKNLQLRIDIAEKINSRLKDIPLVLHGASGLLPEQISAAIRAGICKVNKDTHYQHTYGKTACRFYEQNKYAIIMPPNETEDSWTPQKKIFDPRTVSKEIRKAIAVTAAQLIDEVGSANKSLWK
jgi:fructose-bisphosphate aldolase class II